MHLYCISRFGSCRSMLHTPCQCPRRLPGSSTFRCEHRRRSSSSNSHPEPSRQRCSSRESRSLLLIFDERKTYLHAFWFLNAFFLLRVQVTESFVPSGRYTRERLLLMQRGRHSIDFFTFIKETKQCIKTYFARPFLWQFQVGFGLKKAAKISPSPPHWP